MKIRDIITEADPSELGPMNPKMKDVLSKVHAGDVEQEKADAAAKAKADAEKDSQNKAEQEKIIAFAKKHGYDLEPQDIGYFKKGIEDGKRGSVDRGAGEAYGPHFGAYYRGTQIGYKMKEQGDDLEESATAGATSAGNIASVEAPHLSPGDARGKKSYIGDPRTGVSGTKAPKQPRAKQPKKKDGTAVNALDMKASIFGSPIKR